MHASMRACDHSMHSFSCISALRRHAQAHRTDRNYAYACIYSLPSEAKMTWDLQYRNQSSYGPSQNLEKTDPIQKFLVQRSKADRAPQRKRKAGREATHPTPDDAAVAADSISGRSMAAPEEAAADAICGWSKSAAPKDAIGGRSSCSSMPSGRTYHLPHSRSSSSPPLHRLLSIVCVGKGQPGARPISVVCVEKGYPGEGC